MNYFAHGLTSIGRPWRLAGTATPDWLSAADRSMRLRRRTVEPFVIGDGSPRAELAEGILQHLTDDARFHGSALFHETTAEVAARLSATVGSDARVRAGFTAHIVVELLLDSALIEEDPTRLDRYYAEIGSIDPEVVTATVEAITGHRPCDLEAFVSRFLELRFLRNYGNDEALLRSVNHVRGRVRLEPLPASVASVLAATRSIVRSRAAELLGDGDSVVE